MKLRWVVRCPHRCGAVWALVLTLVLVACAGAKEEATLDAAPAALDGKALVEERCVKCHDLTRVEAAKKSSAGWKTTVERMVGNGAELNEAEQKAVIDYLAKAYPG